MLQKKAFFILLFIIVIVFSIGKIYYTNNNGLYEYPIQVANIEETRKDEVRLLAKNIAKSSTIFLSNFALDELEKKIKLDMENKSIKAIVIKDLFLEQNFLVAFRDKYNEIKFVDELPVKFESYSFVKEKIIEEKSYTKTDLGELILYYNKRKNYYQPTFTKAEKIYLTSKKVIKVCIDPDWMPFETIDNGKHIGVSADYMNLISEQLNKPIKLVPTKTWKESLDKIKNNECDILSLVSKSAKNSKFLKFTSPYIKTNVVIATKVGIPFIDDITKIQHRKIGIVRGYALFDNLKKEYPNINLVEVSSISDGLKKIETGRLFGYIDNSIVMNHAIQKNFLGTVTISGKLEDEMKLSIATKKENIVLHGIFEKVILLLSDDIKQAILNKWSKINYNIETDYTLVWQLTLISLFIIFITLYWIKKLATLNKQLEEQRNKAREASETKAQFLANMSHEIRTPMNAIIGMSHILLHTNLQQEQKESVERIDKSAKSLLRIINDILDFSKIEAGKLKFENERFLLKDVLNDSIDYISLSLQGKDLGFSVDYDKNLSDIYIGDKLRITQILTNLLSNAVKFTHKGEIKLSIIQLENDYIRFEVEDTGIGLSPKEQNKLFRSFSQADDTTSKKYGGTGLGLAISKQLVNMMKGKIWVESEKGKGSRFIFEINVPIEKKDSIIEKTKEKPSFNFENNWILLVEDNKVNQQIITGLLKDSKVHIDIADDGEKAIEKYNNRDAFKYDLILMDIQMPNMDGYDTTKFLRKKGITIPIIALSANFSEEDIKKSLSAGMHEHLKKPIEINKLNKVLIKYLKK